MTERFPVAACGAEAAPASDVASMLDAHRSRLRARPSMATPADDDVRMRVGVLPLPLAFPLLGVEIEKTGDGDLRKQLRRRQFFGRQVQLRRGLALGDPQGVVDDSG